jgi:hypothetical protein
MPVAKIFALCMLAAVAAGCPGGASAICPTISTCSSACCTASTACQDTVCEGVQWGCRLMANGHYGWVEAAPSCSSPAPDLGPTDRGSVDHKGDAAVGCSHPCGQHARCVGSSCVCDKGFANLDTNWNTGCEALDPACGPWSCGSCPDGYCGNHAICRDNVKCRCLGQWLNKHGDDWTNGCDTYSPECRADNCNACYTAYCGPAADCMQNNCKCVAAGAVHCASGWPEYSGCCVNGCSGTSCK